MRALARLLTLGFLLGWLAGCASWGEDTWRQPEVHLVEVEKVKMHLHQQEFVLHLQVDNPNDERLFIRTITYSVHLGDLLLAQDEVSLWRSVAGHARRTFKITARTNLWQHLKLLAAAAQQATVAVSSARRPGHRPVHPSGPALVAQW